VKTLAARCKAARAPDQNQGNSAQRAAMFMRYNEQGDVVLRDENHQEFVLSADECAFVEVEGHEEIVKFGKDVIANMKYMNDKEKKVYRVRDRRTNPHHMMSGTLLLT
jgi:hypothetical protein